MWFPSNIYNAVTAREKDLNPARDVVGATNSVL